MDETQRSISRSVGLKAAADMLSHDAEWLEMKIDAKIETVLLAAERFTAFLYGPEPEVSEEGESSEEIRKSNPDAPDCPGCGGETALRRGESKKDGKPWSGWFCVKQCGAKPIWL